MILIKSSLEEESGNEQNFKAENNILMDSKNNNTIAEENDNFILKSPNLIKSFDEINSFESNIIKKYENNIEINDERKNTSSGNKFIYPKIKKRNNNKSIKDLNKENHLQKINYIKK